MTSEKIIVKIQSDGEIKVETIGMKGEACLDVIELMEQLLQAETIDSAYTAEYYEAKNKNSSTVQNEIRRK
ncbi:MAG: DUF2997 domain-containing protein [Lysinibacillus sp.]